MSVATENFIKTIYQLMHDRNRNTRPGTVAKVLGISNAAATDMARKLSEKKLLVYQKYKELELTEKGKALALQVIRKHRLWETFLHRVLNLSLHEIHDEAETLEHQTSDFLTERISEYLKNPEFDPHGDPIPDPKGQVSFSSDNKLLNFTEDNGVYEVTRLSGSDREFFEFCRNAGILIGNMVKVEKQYPKNKMTEIRINGVRLVLNEEVAGKIYVKQLKNQDQKI